MNKGIRNFRWWSLVLLMVMSLGISSCTKDGYSEPDYGTETGNDDNGGGSSTLGYTFYKTVTARKLGIVDNKVITNNTTKLDIYKKNSKYYRVNTKGGTQYYHPLTRNTQTTCLGVKVTSYNYFSIDAGIAVSYYYYMKI